MKKRRTIERCVRLGVAIACVSAATVLRAGDRAEVSVAGSERADTASFRDIYPDTWVATDAVGRTMPTEEEVGLPKNDQRRVVGIFYITWHTQGLHNLKSPYTADVTKILEQDPSARLDAHHPLWKEGSYHWGEPEMGYFLSQDEWVIRKDVSMLADAGVDVMIMDVTNAVRYWDEWDVIFRTMQRMKAEGNKVPKFCFWAFNGPVITVVQDLYDRIYKPGLYSDLWFEWDGKPLLLYNSRPGIDAAERSISNTNPHYDPDAVTNPAAVRAIIEKIDDLCLGYKLPGAGGGGFLYMMAKDEEAAARIRKILVQEAVNDRARFVEMSLSEKGLEVSRS